MMAYPTTQREHTQSAPTRSELSRGKNRSAGAWIMATVMGVLLSQGQALLSHAAEDGSSYSVTVYPIALLGNPAKNVAEVIALFLEKGGVREIVISDQEFKPADSSDVTGTAGQFKTFLSSNPPATDYAIYGEFLGTPQKGVSEVRTFLSKKGVDSIWSDRQTPSDSEFQRVKPANPMTCCVLMIDRLRTQLKMDDPYRKDAPKGKIAQMWEEKSNMPSDQIRSAMKERLQKMKTDSSKGAITVYSVRLNQKPSLDHAQRLVELIKKEGLISAQVNEKEVNLAVPGNSNEQRVLWDMARMFQEYIQKNPPKSEYALFADYWVSDSNKKVGGVHFVVCDQKGEWVIVDFQNEYQDDFKKLAPQSANDCDRLVVERMKGYLK